MQAGTSNAQNNHKSIIENHNTSAINYELDKIETDNQLNTINVPADITNKSGRRSKRFQYASLNSTQPVVNNSIHIQTSKEKFSSLVKQAANEDKKGHGSIPA